MVRLYEKLPVLPAGAQGPGTRRAGPDRRAAVDCGSRATPATAPTRGTSRSRRCCGATSPSSAAAVRWCSTTAITSSRWPGSCWASPRKCTPGSGPHTCCPSSSTPRRWSRCGMSPGRVANLEVVYSQELLIEGTAHYAQDDRMEITGTSGVDLGQPGPTAGSATRRRWSATPTGRSRPYEMRDRLGALLHRGDPQPSRHDRHGTRTGAHPGRGPRHSRGRTGRTAVGEDGGRCRGGCADRPAARSGAGRAGSTGGLGPRHRRRRRLRWQAQSAEWAER